MNAVSTRGAKEDTKPSWFANPLDLGFVFSVDAETDTLWGPIFAIGVVVLDREGETVDKFEGRIADLSDVKDPWVLKHNLPQCVGLTAYPSRFILLEAFWAFWEKWRDRAIPLSDCGQTAEAHLFRLCVLQNEAARAWGSAFPLFDLATRLYERGINPRAMGPGEEGNRIRLAGLEGAGLVQHNPVDDALASGLAWIKLRAGR